MQFEYSVPFKQIEEMLKYTSSNTPALVMINEPSGNMIYSFGFDFKNTPISKIKENPNQSQKFSTILIRKSFVDAQSGTLVNIKSIYGLSDTMEEKTTDSQ